MPRHRSCIPIAYMNWLLIFQTLSGKVQSSKKQIWWDLVILYLIRTKVTMVSPVLTCRGSSFTSFVHEIEISICCMVIHYQVHYLNLLNIYMGMFLVSSAILTTTTVVTTHTNTIGFILWALFHRTISNPSLLPLGQDRLNIPPLSHNICFWIANCMFCMGLCCELITWCHYDLCPLTLSLTLHPWLPIGWGIV